MKFDIIVNNKQITAKKGETILEVLEREGIKVPTLCHLKDLFPTGACRMCVVEIEKFSSLVPSCSYPVEEGMVISTHSPRVIEARKTIVELLLSNHPDDCLYCERNKNCELQTLAENLNVRERNVIGKKNVYKFDQASPSIVRDPAKCILCGRCVRVCEEREGVSAIDFINRGSKTFIGTAFNKGLNVSSCVNCGQCILVCPTGALHEKTYFDVVQEALNDNDKHVVVQYAPSISVALAEEFGIKAGKDINGLMNAALRKIGFNKVFDTTFAADLTIMEESSELIHRIQNNGKLPMITSCCPGWIKYVEQFYPELLEHVSTCKSPQQMMGAVIKSYYAAIENIDPKKIVNVSVMPCTAKKFEAYREEMIHNGIADIDVVLTTRELARLIRLYSIDIENLDPELADNPLGTRSTAGKIFGTTGGVMEAAVRTAYFKLTGKELDDVKIPELRGFKEIKQTKLDINGLEVGVAVVNGLGNAKQLLDKIKDGTSDVHFIEVMACPGGCINGGGQPIVADENAVKARMKALYNIDEKEQLKVSHKNPYIIELYEKFLGEPLGEKSHHLLHTTYCERKVLI